MRFVVLSLLLFFISCSGTSAHWANDIVGDTDHNFTNGLSVRGRYSREEAPKILSPAKSLPLFADVENTDEVGWVVEQNMYTPDDLRSKEIIEDDVPYSGLLEAGVSRIAQDGNREIVSEIRLGVVGPYSGAERLQKFVHVDLDKGADPEGWHHQIPTEPTINFSHRRTYDTWKGSFFTNQIGGIFRIGTVHDDVILYDEFFVGYNPPSVSSEREDFALYLAARPSVSITAWNLHYDGAAFRDAPHTVESRTLGAAFNVGIVAEICRAFLRFDVNFRSQDFRGQKDAGHVFGLLSVGKRW